MVFFHPLYVSQGTIRPYDRKVLETMTYIVICIHKEHLCYVECEMKFKAWVLTLRQWHITTAVRMGMGPRCPNWLTLELLPTEELWRLFHVNCGSDALKGKATCKIKTKHFLHVLKSKEGVSFLEWLLIKDS